MMLGSVAKAIALLMDDPQRRRKMGQREEKESKKTSLGHMNCRLFWGVMRRSLRQQD